jgi:hypothetical protein
LLSACALAPPRVGEPGPESTDSAVEARYQEVLARYTARSEIYDFFDTRMFIAGTYQSWEFRQWRVKRMGVQKAQPPPVIEKLLGEEQVEAEKFHDFFVAAHLNDDRFEDFDKRESIWRVALVGAQGEVTPSLIRRIGRSDLNMRAVYPYAGEFWVGYHFRFPKESLAIAAGEPFILRVASTLGKAEMHFRP